MIRGKEKLLWLRAALSFLGVLVLSYLVGMLASVMFGQNGQLFFVYPTLLLGIILTLKVAWRRKPK
jgi:Na+/melibiose symporter-like transporter